MSNTQNELQDRILGHILKGRAKSKPVVARSNRGARTALVMIGLAILIALLTGCSAKTETLLAPKASAAVVTEAAAPSNAQPESPVATPVETAPAAVAPATTAPAVKPVVTKPAATKPAATKPAATKPAATKPAEVKIKPVVGVETPWFEASARTIVAAYTTAAPTRWEHNYGLVAQGKDVLFVSFTDGVWRARWYRGLDHYSIEQTDLGKTFIASCNADASTGRGYAQRVGSSYSKDVHPGAQIWLPVEEFLSCND